MHYRFLNTARLCVLFTIALMPSGRVVAQTALAVPQVRRLSVDEAVRTALENNLGVQVARVDPLIQDLSVAVARAAWAPTFNSTLQTTSTDTPNNSFLSGAQGPR